MPIQKIDAFDFDGTLVSINSFHLFLIFLGVHSIVHFRFIVLSKLLMAIFARLSKKTSHLDFKRQIHSIGLLLTEDQIRIFFKWLSPFRRDCVFDALKRSNEDPESCTVIASAAPYAYMKYAKFYFAADFVISFGDPRNLNPLLFDNTGERKLINIAARLTTNPLRLNRVYTNHIDDLPLTLVAEEVVLVRPKSEFPEALAARSVKFRVIQ